MESSVQVVINSYYKDCKPTNEKYNIMKASSTKEIKPLKSISTTNCSKNTTNLFKSSNDTNNKIIKKKVKKVKKTENSLLL